MRKLENDYLDHQQLYERRARSFEGEDEGDDFKMEAQNDRPRGKDVEGQTLSQEKPSRLQMYEKMLGSGKIIWNEAAKIKFERLEKEKRQFKRVRLGLEKMHPADYIYGDKNHKKPRPKDLISEKIMIGKWGPQTFQKKDYLGSHLLPKDDSQPIIKSDTLEEDSIQNAVRQSGHQLIRIDDNASEP